MRRHLHRSFLAGLLVLGGCNAIFGIQGGSLSGTGGSATATGDAGPADAGDASSTAEAGTGGGPGCSATTFPLTPVLDGFTRADGTLGQNWLVDTPGGYQITSDQLVANTGNPGIMVWSDVLGPTQEAYIKIVAFDPGDGELELILKNQGMITECDGIEVDYQPNGIGPGQGMLGVYACTAGNPGTYGSAPFTLAPGDRFGARACAEGTVEVFKNGTLVNTFDVSPFAYATSSGRIGFFSSSLTAAAQLDDFGGGTVP
jgi:hypothetical protein